MNHDVLEHAGSVPAERIGARLHELRTARGLTRRQVARATDLSVFTLGLYERGKRRPSPTHMRMLAEVLDVDVVELVPGRSDRPVDVSGGVVTVAGTERDLGTADPSAEDVLDGYLSLVYQLRGISTGSPVPLRDDDLDVLAEVLGNTPEAIESRLIELIDCTAEEASRIRRIILRKRMLGPVAGLAFGAAVATPAIADSLNGGSTPETPAVTSTTVEVEIGDGVVIETPAAAPSEDVSAASVAEPDDAPAAVADEEPAPSADPSDDEVDIGTAVVIERNDDGSVTYSEE